MVSLLDSLQLSKHLVLYVLLISLARGILFPDFRLDIFSIVLIQVIYPVALLAPMAMRLHGEYFWGYYFLCLGGIVLAAIVALLRYYLEAGKENVVEQVSTAVLFVSFIAQVGLLTALVVLLFLIQKEKVI